MSVLGLNLPTTATGQKRTLNKIGFIDVDTTND
jgi:hypothetical protein